MSSWKNLVARWGSGAGETDDVRIDGSTNALETIEYEHHEIHSGSAFTCHYANDVTNIGEMTAIGFNTPNTTTWVHLTVEAETTGAAYVALYENTSIDVDEGTQLTIYNRNRNSATAATVTTIETVPVANLATSYNEAQAAGANITTTTELAINYLGAGERKSVGGASRGVQEWVLDQNQQYCVLMYSLTNDDATHNITLDWYEHVDKN
jgi:hypothetical protein